MNIRTIIKLDKLITSEQTGTPRDLSLKLELTERAIYKNLKFMKEELNAPIEFSKLRGSYCYIGEGSFCFKWCNK